MEQQRYRPLCTNRRAPSVLHAQPASEQARGTDASRSQMAVTRSSDKACGTGCTHSRASTRPLARDTRSRTRNRIDSLWHRSRRDRDRSRTRRTRKRFCSDKGGRTCLSVQPANGLACRRRRGSTPPSRLDSRTMVIGRAGSTCLRRRRRYWRSAVAVSSRQPRSLSATPVRDKAVRSHCTDRSPNSDGRRRTMPDPPSANPILVSADEFSRSRTSRRFFGKNARELVFRTSAALSCSRFRTPLPPDRPEDRFRGVGGPDPLPGGPDHHPSPPVR